MIDTQGLADYIEKCVAFTNYVIEQSQLTQASLIEMRGATTDLVNLVPRARIYQYWRKHWPQGQYPSVADWQLMRGELDAGALAFVRVGPSEAGSFWIRLMSLTPEETPTNGTFIDQFAPDNTSPKSLCPLHGAKPANAIWECIIYSTRTGA